MNGWKELLRLSWNSATSLLHFSCRDKSETSERPFGFVDRMRHKRKDVTSLSLISWMLTVPSQRPRIFACPPLRCSAAINISLATPWLPAGAVMSCSRVIHSKVRSLCWWTLTSFRKNLFCFSRQYVWSRPSIHIWAPLMWRPSLPTVRTHFSHEFCF